MKTIYVGNIPFTSSENELRELFERHGHVHSIKLINDRATGRSRGFGFIEMDEDAGKLAITALNDIDFQGHNLRVNEAHVHKPRPRLNKKLLH